MSTVEVHKQITADEIAHTFEDEVPKGADLSQYAPEDWLALVIFWIMALSRLPAVLHPLCPQRQSMPGPRRSRPTA